MSRLTSCARAAAATARTTRNGETSLMSFALNQEVWVNRGGRQLRDVMPDRLPEEPATVNREPTTTNECRPHFSRCGSSVPPTTNCLTRAWACHRQQAGSRARTGELDSLHRTDDADEGNAHADTR